MGYTYTPSPLHYRHQDITFLACLHPVRNWHTSRETKINAPTYKYGSRLCGGRTANEKLRFNSKPGGTSKGTKQSAPPPERESTFDYCFHYWPSSVVKCYICLLCFIFFTPLADMTQGVKDPHAQSKHEDIPNGVCGAVQRS